MAVWDPLVRLFHWSLAGFFFLAYFLENDWPALHSHAGYTVALLVMFRIFWGFIGSKHARFSDFVASPARLLTYLQALQQRSSQPATGHDPAGAVMILLLLSGLLVTTLSGMSLFAMEGSGPLAGTFVSTLPGAVMVDVHLFFTDFCLALIVLHVVGVLVMSVLTRQNLIVAMISGRKPGKAGS
jgi:cytochrome b